MRQLALITMAVIVLAACNKEKQLEKTVTKKDGVWDISTVDWELVKVVGFVSQTVNVGTSTNAGTFTFNESGSGSYDFTVNDTTFIGDFSWTNDEDSIYLNKVSVTFNPITFESEQHVVAYSAAKVGKNELEMTGGDVLNTINSQSVFAGEFVLTR